MPNREKYQILNLEKIAEGKLRAQVALRHLENIQGFTNAVNTGSDMFCFFDAKGYFVWVSKKWTSVLGWSFEELCAVPFLDLIHPEDVVPTLQAFEDGKLKKKDRQRQSNFFINRYRHKDGHYVQLEWNVDNHPDDSFFGEGKVEVEEFMYGFGRATPLHDRGDLTEQLQSKIDTVFLNTKQDNQPMVVGIEYWELFTGMNCRDISPMDNEQAVWQILLNPNIGQSMDWHRHPNQSEWLQVITGELNIEVQRFTPLQWLGLQSKQELIWTKKVTLRPGNIYKGMTFNRWHKVLPSKEGANYLVIWKPRQV